MAVAIHSDPDRPIRSIGRGRHRWTAATSTGSRAGPKERGKICHRARLAGRRDQGLLTGRRLPSGPAPRRAFNVRTSSPRVWGGGLFWSGCGVVYFSTTPTSGSTGRSAEGFAVPLRNGRGMSRGMRYADGVVAVGAGRRSGSARTTRQMRLRPVNTPSS